MLSQSAKRKGQTAGGQRRVVVVGSISGFTPCLRSRPFRDRIQHGPVENFRCGDKSYAGAQFQPALRIGARRVAHGAVGVDGFFGAVTPGPPTLARASASASNQSEFDRVSREQRVRAATYVKPTVTAQMGDIDLGGKYFGQTPDPAKTRHYYIAAESEKWDYLPSGSDEVCGMALTPAVLMKHSVWKVRYFQYTDATFTKRVPQPSRLGILGPVLRGVVGEYLEVTFLNREIGGVYSMHPHGVKYDKDSEGSYHSDRADKLASRERTNDNWLPPFQGRGAAYHWVWRAIHLRLVY